MINRIAMRLAMARAMYKVADYGANGVYEKEALLTPNIVNKLYELTWKYIFRNNGVVQTLRKNIEDKLKTLNSQHGKGNDPSWLPPKKPGFELMKALLTHDKKFTSDLIMGLSRDNDKKKIPIIVLRDNYKPQYNYLTTFCMKRDGTLWDEAAIRENLRKMHPEEDVDDNMILSYDREQEDNDVQKIKGQIALFKSFTENVWNYVATQFSNNNNGNGAVEMLYNSMINDNATNDIDGYKLTVDQIYKADWSSYYEQLKESKDRIQKSIKFSQALPEKIWTYYKNKFTYDPTVHYTQKDINDISACTNITPQKNGPYNALCKDWLFKSDFDHSNLIFALIDYLAQAGRSKDVDKLSDELSAVGIDLSSENITVTSGFKELLLNRNSLINRTLKSALYAKFEEMKQEARAFLKALREHNKELKKNLVKDPQTGEIYDMDLVGSETQEDIQRGSGAYKIIDEYNSKLRKNQDTVRYQTETFDVFDNY